MVMLKGKNLGERQKELNVKVNEAASSNVDFEQIKQETEISDVDKLFKIDLASKYKNIDYIIEVLTSGDTLHISRALKCVWIYNEEFSHIINVDYLQDNVFPYMSTKMKKKLLLTVSMHVRNENRAISFYEYCKDIKLYNLSLKFVIFTSNDYKLELLRRSSNDHILSDLCKNDFLKYFFGNSFDLVDAYLTEMYGDSRRLKTLKCMSYLYSVSDVKYLSMLEKHADLHPCTEGRFPRLGLRISKDIITKHNDRVIANPALYMNFLNMSSILKYTNVENAKKYLTGLLPYPVNHFWPGNVYGSYKYLVNKLPEEERFVFIKKIYCNQYPNHPFEMHPSFYSLNYVMFMTAEQKEQWALDQIASQKELRGVGNDYQWYKYINFEKAFVEIKKLVMITTDRDKRNEMVNVLIDSCKTHRDLEKLFTYYYDRHNNEVKQTKENFMQLVSDNHNILEFDKDCWAAFNKIYQNLDVYSLLENKCRTEFKVIALIYHIIHEMDVHDALKLYVRDSMSTYMLKRNTNRISKEKQEIVFQYIFKFYINEIIALDSVPYDDNVKYELRKYIHYILDLLDTYDKTKDEIPEIVDKFVKLDWDEFKYEKFYYCTPIEEEEEKDITQDDLIRLLKKEANLVIGKVPLVMQNIENYKKFHLGRLLKKLKVYFTNDISKVYLNFFSEILTAGRVSPKVARAACYGIFQLGEDSFMVDFMTKHAPTDGKVNRSEIDESLLNIQEAICATAIYARPPIPLKTMLMYVKGDYVSNCLPMFNSYLINLTPSLCIEFINAILNNPLSIQKHGLRLAFACFSLENLNKLVLHVWKKTKNVSLRALIYKALYDRIVHEYGNPQKMLFETLKTFILDLHQDDDPEVFSLLTHGGMPREIHADLTDAAWKTVSELPVNRLNQERKEEVLEDIYYDFELIHQHTVQRIVEKFINDNFNTEEAIKPCLESTRWNNTMWNLIAKYITFVCNKDDLESKLNLTKLILARCLSTFNLVNCNTYIMRKFTFEFIRKLLDFSFQREIASYEYINEIFRMILQMLEASLSIQDTYMLLWEIRLNIEARNGVVKIQSKSTITNDDAKKRVIARDEILIFGRGIGTLIKEFQGKDLYFKIFLPDIVKVFVATVERMAIYIRGFNIEYRDVLVLTSMALMEFKTSEMYLFALSILPSDYDRQYVEDFMSVFNEIKDINDIEMTCKLYDKFVLSDFKPRSFLKL